VTGNLNLTATTGDIEVLADSTILMGTVTFNSPGSVTLVEDDDTEIVGSNTARSLQLTSAGALIDPAQITVLESAVFTGTSIYLAGDAADVLNVSGNLLLNATGGGSITVAEAGTVTLGSLTFQTTGTVEIHEDDGMLPTGTNTAGSVTLSADGLLSNSASSTLTVDQHADLTASSINLGNATADSVNFGTLTLHVTGTANIAEDSSQRLINSSTVGSLTLTRTVTSSLMAPSASQHSLT
jgi:hypothetical protein